MIVSQEGKFLIATPTKCGTTTLESISKRAANDGWLDLVDADFNTAWSMGASAELLETLDTRRRQHRMTPPYGSLGDMKPYLLVRNPLSRWVSVYEYLRAPQNYSQWGARAVQGREWGGRDPVVRRELAHTAPLGFRRFLEWVTEQRHEYDTGRGSEMARKRGPLMSSRAYRSPWVWLDTLVDSKYALAVTTGKNIGHKKLIHLETLSADLERILKEHGAPVDSLDLRIIQANRTKNPKHRDWRDYYRKPGARSAALELGVDIECNAVGYGSLMEQVPE